MIDKGINPDAVTYTTLIDANNRVGKFDKCWELFRKAREWGNDDEQMLSFMVRIAGKTHEAEKAFKIFADMEADGYMETAKSYNSIISALGSTKRFADKAIEYFNKMQIKGIVPDEHTYVAVLRATSKIGDT